MPPGENPYYTIREISIPEGKTHSCTGHITAVLGASFNSTRRVWYLTVLVERSALDTSTTIEGSQPSAEEAEG